MKNIFIFGSIGTGILLFFIGLFLGYKGGYIPLYDQFIVAERDIDCQITEKHIYPNQNETLLDEIVGTRWRDEYSDATALTLREYSMYLDTLQDISLKQVFLVPILPPSVLGEIVYAQLEDILPMSLSKGKPIEKSKKYLVLSSDISIPLSYMVIYKKNDQDMAQLCPVISEGE